MKKLSILFIKVLLILLEAALGVGLYLLYQYSFFVARMYSEVAYMRIPVYFFLAGTFLSVMVALFFGYRALNFYASEEVFREKTAKALKYCGNSFFAGALLLIGLMVYTDMNVKGSITNFWVFLGVILLLLGNRIFALLSDVIIKGKKLQEEQDLTI